MPPLHAPPAGGFTLRRYPFSRSYGVNLPSSLTRVISTPEDSLLTHLCRFRVRFPHSLARGFSWQPGITHLVTKWSRHHLSEYRMKGFTPWSWNYRGCWHQTFPPMATLRVIYTQIMENRQKTIQSGITMLQISGGHLRSEQSAFLHA